MSSEMEPCPHCALHEASPAPCCEAAAAETAQAEAETMNACCWGIRGMVEKDVYCADILVQVAAANSALNAFSRELLSQHVRTCVADDLRAGSDEKLDELLKLLPKLMK